MPKSKTRRPAQRVDRPAPRPPATLETATLALTQASMEIVREAELHITAAARSGEQDKVDEALRVHHMLRSASLGFLRAYSMLSGLPDPVEHHPHNLDYGTTNKTEKTMTTAKTPTAAQLKLNHVRTA
jgi:hypothetical protein